LFDQIWRQWATGKAVKARISGPASSRSAAACGKRSSSCSTTRPVLGVHLLRRGLLVDGAHHRRHRWLRPLRHPAQEVGHEVGTAALPAGAGRDRSESSKMAQYVQRIDDVSDSIAVRVRSILVTDGVAEDRKYVGGTQLAGAVRITDDGRRRGRDIGLTQ
jgi:hypothetical protein